MTNFGYQPQQGQGYSQQEGNFQPSQGYPYQEGNFQPSQGYPQPAPIYPQPVRMYPQQGGNAQPQMGQGPYTLPSGFQQPVNTQGYSLQPMPLQRTDDWPVFGCDFKTAIQRFFRKYAVFHGRASRSEYWFAQLGLGIVNAVFTALWQISHINPVLDSVVGSITGVLLTVWGFAVFVPSLALFVRRLHDVNMKGAWVAVPLVFNFLAVVSLVIVSVITLMSYSSSYDNSGMISAVFLIVLVFFGATLGFSITIGVKESKPEGIRFDR